MAPESRCALILRNAAARSKLKINVVGDVPLSRQDLGTKIIFQRDLCEGVLKKFRVGGDPGLLFSRPDQCRSNPACNATIFPAEQTGSLGGINDDLMAATGIFTVGGLGVFCRSPRDSHYATTFSVQQNISFVEMHQEQARL